METATVRIPAEKRDLLKIIAEIEKTEIKVILTETLDLLSRPEWVDAITRGKLEVETGVAGASLDELED